MKMQYRVNQRTKDQISVIGLGTAYLPEAGMKEAVDALQYAAENGINYFDLAAADGKAFDQFREALSDVRKQVLYQIHFGADYSKVTYGWTLDLDKVKRSISWQLEHLKTDYIDYGFIHCQDELSDWETYQRNGVLDYLLGLKQSGVVHHIGMSSHTPSVAQKILDTGLVDMMMFSINPGYDFHHGDYARGGVDERTELFRRAQRDGVGITVMKPFSGGQMLDAGRSPFGVAMTRNQCIRYCLDKPGVLTVLPGVRSKEDVKALLTYFDASEEETDYSVVGTFAPPEASGKCVYCNHCKPCPVGLDIGLINKYYDLARLGDDLAAEHYRALELTASDCVSCGHCDSRCPFSVHQSARMQEIAEYFGK